MTSPVASPSGDLVAALSGYRGKIDVVLFDAKNRQADPQPDRGFTQRLPVSGGQELAAGRGLGRDLAFSPDGNTIAVFAKRERGRSLLLIDVLSGRPQTSSTWTTSSSRSARLLAGRPDVAFSAWRNGQFDIFTLDLETRQDHQPHRRRHLRRRAGLLAGRQVASSSSRRSATATTRSSASTSTTRGRAIQVTTGESNENDPIFSPDGKRLYFTSDRDGPENIFSLELATGKLRQYTNVVTGAFMPTVLRETDGKERLVYDGYWRRASTSTSPTPTSRSRRRSR